jgi:hypothetical protein
MGFQNGDRVRVRLTLSEYTGCRGTIVDGPDPSARRESALGHFVAIDGENGKARPFLLGELELLRAAAVRRAAPGRSLDSKEA